MVGSVVLAGLLMMGCGQGIDRGDLIREFLLNNSEATEVQAECVIDRLLERYDIDQLEVELRADPLDADFEEAQFRDMFACGLQGDVGQQITRQLEANGVDPERAPCVSQALVAQLTDDDIDVLLSGQITDTFYQKFFDAMEGCGAVG